MCKHMLWKTHVRISYEVLRRLGISLSDEVAKSFKDGILAPDQWKDYPHHYGKSENIKQHLMKSRGYFLQDDVPNAFFHLGVALHYIQDSYTSMASFYPKHQSWEESIEYANFTYDLEKTINYSLRNKLYERDRCLKLANALSKEAQGRDNTLHVATLSGHAASKSFAKPIVDLNLGMRASLVVTESVLSSKNCVALERKLKDGLSYYETLLRSAEEELSNNIIRLANERAGLEKRRVPSSGIVSEIRNWVLGVRIRLKEHSVNSNNNYYTKQGHLDKVVREYLKAASGTVTPYVGWYNFQIPRINPNVVGKELLSVQEIAKILGENEHALKESLNRVNVLTYHVGNRELVRRAELDRFLSQFPVNGFVKYPS
jgi:hypothetical protein